MPPALKEVLTNGHQKLQFSRYDWLMMASAEETSSLAGREDDERVAAEYGVLSEDVVRREPFRLPAKPVVGGGEMLGGIERMFASMRMLAFVGRPLQEASKGEERGRWEKPPTMVTISASNVALAAPNEHTLKMNS